MPNDTPNPDPTATQVTPPSDQNEIPAWVIAVNASNAARGRAEAELAELKSRINSSAPPQELPKLEKGDVFDNPDKLMESIQTLLDRQISPIRQDLEASKRRIAYDNAKATILRTYPHFIPTFKQ